MGCDGHVSVANYFMNTVKQINQKIAFLMNMQLIELSNCYSFSALQSTTLNIILVFSLCYISCMIKMSCRCQSLSIKYQDMKCDQQQVFNVRILYLILIFSRVVDSTFPRFCRLGGIKFRLFRPKSTLLLHIFYVLNYGDCFNPH